MSNLFPRFNFLFKRASHKSIKFMPELPEVQTIVDDLNKKIKGDTIVGFWSDWKRSVKNKNFNYFQKEINNKKILATRRIGKNIFINLSEGKTLYIHLKMTGHLLIKKQRTKNKEQKKPKSRIQKSKPDYFSEKVNQYIHHIWKLKTQNVKLKTKDKTKSYDKTLEFSDLRKFGKIILVDTNEVENLPEIKSLGIDALDRKFNLKKFEEILEKRPKSLIGIILMDQNLIAGIGNIYRSEILFEAGVRPERKVASLSSEEIRNIFKNIKKVLKKAIEMRGTSDSDYRDTSGTPGRFQKVLRVYGRVDEKCEKCATIIKRIKIGQRSAFYCLRCQR